MERSLVVRKRWSSIKQLCVTSVITSIYTTFITVTDGAVKYIGIDGARLVTVAYKKALTLWDLESGRALRAVDNELGVSRVHLAQPHAVSLHRKSGTLSIWDLEESRRVRTLRLDKQVRS